jgi:micrococcal nuclease
MRRSGLRSALTSAASFLLAACAQPARVELPAPIAPFPAIALTVESGDALVVRHARSQRVERVRLEGIDAPELGQPFGSAAAGALSARVSGASLVVSATAREADGSLRGWLCPATEPYFARWSYPACGPASSVNLALVRSGDAWASPGSATAAVFTVAQTDARSGRVGLWADPGPVPPWQWRALDPGLRAAILAPVTAPTAGGPVASAPATGPPASAVGAAAVAYPWFFGAAAAPAAEPSTDGGWLRAWEGLLDELF